MDLNLQKLKFLFLHVVLTSIQKVKAGQFERKKEKTIEGEEWPSLDTNVDDIYAL